MIKIGIDIGGAFTDLYVVDFDKNKKIWVKVESTPPDFEKGVIHALEEIEDKGVDIGSVSQIIHGQTVVINTIITRKGSKVGFITTKGFDILEIQRANRRDIFNFRYVKPKPFVSREFTAWVTERIDSDGSIYIPLRENEVEEAVSQLLKKGAQSFAIGFINSYVNPAHEMRAKEIIETILKEKGYRKTFVTASSEISREWREYERFNTAVLNAYVQPIFVNYVEKLEYIFREKGFRGTFYITLASGGMVVSEFAKKYPIFTIEGGPVSGIVGGIAIAKHLGEDNIIVIDGGSTTTKAGVVKKLVPEFLTEYWIEQDDWHAGYPLRVPLMGITEIGLGGTSIIWIDEIGNLQVGPMATGANPGPACYRRGGNLPTLTDAYVITGYLNPEYLLGGKLKIDKDLAVKALKNISNQLGLDVKEVAYGAIRIANEKASNLIRQITIKKGVDPREFSLIAHGGAGPMFAPFIAKELKIPRIIIPAIQTGVFNAWGMLQLDIRHEIIQTNTMWFEISRDYAEKLSSLFEKIEELIKNMFRDEGIDPASITFQRFLDLKYEGQAHTLRVPCPSGRIDMDKLIEVEKAFHTYHFNEYGFSLSNSKIILVNIYVIGVHEVKHVELERTEHMGDLSEAYIGDRLIYNGEEEIYVDVYKKEKLPAKAVIKGPCIIESDTATAIVLNDQVAYNDEYGNLVIKVRE
ncbi:MAG: hydantoinase/oxoprolinase family protein [Desulfurococcaceae archaeon]